MIGFNLQWFFLLAVLSFIAATDRERPYVDPPELHSAIHEFDLYIVYFVFIHPTRHRYMEVISEQFDTFNCNGMMNVAKEVYVPLSIDASAQPEAETIAILHSVTNMLRNLSSKVIIDITLENQFEYPGMLTVWEIGQRMIDTAQSERSIIAYTHSKGMFYTHMTDPSWEGARTPHDIDMYHLTFDRWDEVMDMYSRFPELNKVGCVPARKGHIWVNMFFVRASYTQLLVPPTKGAERFFYEHWLAQLDRDADALKWPRLSPRGAAGVRSIEYTAAINVTRPRKNSFCADCWSTCVAGEYTLGRYFEPTVDGMPDAKGIDWYRCRAAAPTHE